MKVDLKSKKQTSRRPDTSGSQKHKPTTEKATATTATATATATATTKMTLNKKLGKKGRRRTVEFARPRTNKKPKLVDIGAMKAHNFMSSTEATMTKMYPMLPVTETKYEVAEEPGALSIVMKLILKTDQTNPMTLDWSTVLWDITQKNNMLPQGVLVTFTRHFERLDNKLAEKDIKRRSQLAVLSSDNAKNRKSQGVFVRHDAELIRSIERGDSVVSFGAEAIITAPNDELLGEAMEAIQNYLKSNDETRGLHYELDVNRQLQPFILYGPNKVSKNKDVSMEMTSEEAGISALFVDSGGDRTPGSEYIGISIGKMIQSHAAYSLQNNRTLVVGNETTNVTHTMMGKNMLESKHNLPSQIYWSQVISRSYLLENHSVTHIVLDHATNVEKLMSIELNDNNKLMIDTAKGYLNILEVIGNGNEEDMAKPERIVGRFTTHLNNIIALLSQYRDVNKLSTTDDFASITRTILTNFFVSNKYYTYNPLANLDDIRLIGRHDQYKTLADFGGWVAQQRKSNTDDYIKDALAELNTIINENILPTIPALNTKTDPIVDKLLSTKYRVVDLTGMSVGSIMNSGDSTTNVMVISYLNLILPSLNNGDVIFLHGFSKLDKISSIIQDMIANSGSRVDIVFTESNQNKAERVMKSIADELDLAVVDLYQNKVDKIEKQLKIDKNYAADLFERPGYFYLKTRQSSDYVVLDDIL